MIRAVIVRVLLLVEVWLSLRESRRGDLSFINMPWESSQKQRTRVHLDQLLAERRMTLVELSKQVGVTVANLSILKNGRARAIRFSTLEAICRTLDCQPGDILTFD